MRSIRSELKLQKASSRWLGRSSGLLGLSALVHTGVLIGTGGGWSGAVSFRKPITFGVSVGLLLWTSGWVIDRLPKRPKLESVMAATLIGSGLAEVGLITMQAWRGVPSHFNITTSFDSSVFAGMGASIGVFSLALLSLTTWVSIERPAAATTRLAVLAGMAFVLSGLGLGQWVINLGVEMADQLGRAPDTVLVGEAGVAKFPHAMALHGIQLFIGVAVLARLGGLSLRHQQWTVRLSVVGYLAMVTWSVVHTNAGRSPVDLRGVESMLALIGAVLLLGTAGMLVVGGKRARMAHARTTVPVTFPA